MEIRMMEQGDIEEAVLNEERIFSLSLGEKVLMDELLHNPFAKYFVMVDDKNHLIGQIGFWATPPTADIINFYIVEEYRGKKLGSELLCYGLDYLSCIDVNTVTLEVRVSNEKAISLYKKFGFFAVSIRKEYYPNGEDAYLMLKNL